MKYGTLVTWTNQVLRPLPEPAPLCAWAARGQYAGLLAASYSKAARTEIHGAADTRAV